MAAKGSRSPSSPGHGAAHGTCCPSERGHRAARRGHQHLAIRGSPGTSSGEDVWDPGACQVVFWVPRPLPGHAGARGQWGCQSRELRPTAHCWAACDPPKDLHTLPPHPTASVMLGRGSGTGCPHSAVPCTRVPCATPGDGQGWGTGHPPCCDANMSPPCRRKTQISSPTSQARSWASPTGTHQLFSPSSAPYHSGRVGRNCPWVLPAPLSLLQWDGAVQIPMACPRGSTGSRSRRMGATIKRQLLSWPRNTLIPEDPRAQTRCSSRGRA